MRKIKEVLRLHYELGLGQHQIRLDEAHARVNQEIPGNRRPTVASQIVDE